MRCLAEGDHSYWKFFKMLIFRGHQLWTCVSSEREQTMAYAIGGAGVIKHNINETCVSGLIQFWGQNWKNPLENLHFFQQTVIVGFHQRNIVRKLCWHFVHFSLTLFHSSPFVSFTPPPLSLYLCLLIRSRVRLKHSTVSLFLPCPSVYAGSRERACVYMCVSSFARASSCINVHLRYCL